VIFRVNVLELYVERLMACGSLTVGELDKKIKSEVSVPLSNFNTLNAYLIFHNA
jgi:hypothetical protein